MSITKRNIGKHEMIGLNTTVKEMGIKGMIIDETKNSFLIRTDSKTKKVLKKGKTFFFGIDDGVKINGDKICFRPEDRLKKVKMK